MTEARTALELDEDEINTILAALRFYQHRGMGEPSERPNWLQDIACPDPGNNTSLDAAGIDELCERLNCGPVPICPDDEDE